jgi:hypothetical protein
MLWVQCQKRTRVWGLPTSATPFQGDAPSASSLLVSKARGRQAPATSLHPVGGWRWYM